MIKAAKYISVMVALVMTLMCGTGLLSAQAANSDVKITFEATNVTGAMDTLELKLNVGLTNNEKFKSVGTVLQFDNTVLELIPWENYVAYDFTGATSWDSAKVIGTKSPDEHAGGVATAYKEGNKTYLYLSAETVNGQVLPRTNTEGDAVVEPVVAVRFKYAQSKSKEDVKLGVASDGTIQFATDTVAFASTAQHSILYHNDTDFYYYNPLTKDNSGNVVADATVSADKKLTVNMIEAFPAVKDGSSIVPSKTGTPVVFYDWDNTLLGAIVLADGEKPEDKIKEFEDGLKATLADGTLYSPDQGKPLTNKKGYTFEGWIDYSAVDENGYEVYTNFGAVVNVKSNMTMADDLVKPTLYNFAQGASSMTVKAVYGTNADMEPLRNPADVTDRNYTITPEAYLQFGTTTNYQITVKIKRENSKGQGVPRVRELGLRTALTIRGSGEKVFLLQTLDNKDEISASVAVNGQVEVAEMQVIDLCDRAALGGTSAWATASTGRSANLTETPTTEEAHGGFVFKSTVGYINDQLKMAYELNDTVESMGSTKPTSGASVSTNQFSAADLSVSTVAGETGSVLLKRRKALGNMYAMYISLPEKRNLTWDELQEAITRGTVWQDGGWTNGFTGTYQPPA
jgi:hypothetical protein